MKALSAYRLLLVAVVGVWLTFAFIVGDQFGLFEVLSLYVPKTLKQIGGLYIAFANVYLVVFTLIDVWRRETTTKRLAWTIFMVILTSPISLIYYYAEIRPNRKAGDRK